MIRTEFYGHIGKGNDIRIANLRVSDKDIACIYFGDHLSVLLAEPQLRDLAAKIEAELQDRMAETIKLAAGNPQLIADLKKNWKGTKEVTVDWRPSANEIKEMVEFSNSIKSPEAETAQQPPNTAPEHQGQLLNPPREMTPDEIEYFQSTYSEAFGKHSRANAEQVEMLEKETL